MQAAARAGRSGRRSGCSATTSSTVGWPQLRRDRHHGEHAARSRNKVHGTLHGPGYSGGGHRRRAHRCRRAALRRRSTSTRSSGTPACVVFSVDGTAYFTVDARRPAGGHDVGLRPPVLHHPRPRGRRQLTSAPRRHHHVPADAARRLRARLRDACRDGRGAFGVDRRRGCSVAPAPPRRRATCSRSRSSSRASGSATSIRSSAGAARWPTRGGIYEPLLSGTRRGRSTSPWLATGLYVVGQIYRTLTFDAARRCRVVGRRAVFRRRRRLHVRAAPSPARARPQRGLGLPRPPCARSIALHRRADVCATVRARARELRAADDRAGARLARRRRPARVHQPDIRSAPAPSPRCSSFATRSGSSGSNPHYWQPGRPQVERAPLPRVSVERSGEPRARRGRGRLGRQLRSRRSIAPSSRAIARTTATGPRSSAASCCSIRTRGGRRSTTCACARR